MSKLKLLLRLTAWAAIVMVVGVAVLYLLASWKPSHYRPAGQTQVQKERAAQTFIKVIGTLTTNQGEPYDWTLPQDQVNSFLDAIDEIAFMRPNSHERDYRRGDVHHVMDQAGLAEPCVRFSDDCMTLMIRTNEYGKILSADIGFSFTDDGKVKVHLKATRVGLLPVPRFAVRRRLEQYKQTLEERLERIAAARAELDPEGAQYSIEGFSAIDMTELFATIISAIDEDPLPAKLKFIHARVKDIHISDGLMVLEIVPDEYDDEDD